MYDHTITTDNKLDNIESKVSITNNRKLYRTNNNIY